MNVKIHIFAALATLAFVACSHIDEEDRLIYVKPAAAQRCVLLEDFTGQRCINCPKANDEIHALQEQYGADTVIAVAIHSGPLGFCAHTATDEKSYEGVEQGAARAASVLNEDTFFKQNKGLLLCGFVMHGVRVCRLQ